MSPVPAVVSSALTAGLWPLLISITAIMTVTIVALVRAEKADIPAVFESFARAFGLQRKVREQRDTDSMPPVERSDEEEL
ncbi:hypothetical protein AB0H71_16980 [Nocardia sp. NPDC050697]|uniref:hypothetical protein n=1 Tax=Nocardia sp. NPDC050697 TaxID=3155158 RepID=UPI0033C8E866